MGYAEAKDALRRLGAGGPDVRWRAIFENLRSREIESRDSAQRESRSSGLLKR